MQLAAALVLQQLLEGLLHFDEEVDGHRAVVEHLAQRLALVGQQQCGLVAGPQHTLQLVGTDVPGEFGRERRFFFGHAMNAVAVPINATTVQGTDSPRQCASWYRPTGSAPSTARR